MVLLFHVIIIQYCLKDAIILIFLTHHFLEGGGWGVGASWVTGAVSELYELPFGCQALWKTRIYPNNLCSIVVFRHKFPHNKS